jgi:hypothetical protein
MRSGVGLSLLLVFALLSLGLAPCDEDYEPPSPAPQLEDCRYEQSPSLRSNEVQISGGASCAEARQLIMFGPSFRTYKRHSVLPVGGGPRITRDWICEAEQSGFRVPTLDVVCESADREVAYILRPRP